MAQAVALFHAKKMDWMKTKKMRKMLRGLEVVMVAIVTKQNV